MGGCFSSSSSSTSNIIRLVHLSGYVEDFDQPILVNQVIRNSPKHFICTSMQLLSSTSQPLKGDTQLQLGNVYFMLPYSILQANFSPVGMASLANRLTTIAKTRCGSKKSLESSPNSLLNQNELCNIWSSPSRSPSRLGVVVEEIGVTYGARNSLRLQPWKPLLDTIREKSFNRRSESDLQQNH
ncbi:hypothetical protein Lal_00010806 [Lupinus albus]|uniref:Uncharacterized protein n=1 Tax=Lupinus albus TaxID=3870 RepID=A0A6A5P5L1_LUPAL|nr:hypothetical protein Lalb_Chr11g0074841 [Lupinus albus]KAF1892341.1 hypothetical protein Lal_00010806 [Lupinus albus]